MNPASVSLDDRETASAAEQRPRFVAPGPGTWFADRAHVDHPRCRYVQELDREYAEGFRQGFRHYGALLETIEFAYVCGFPYLCPRPIGAPPEPKRPPPKLLFKLVVRLHPELRRRLRRAKVVLEQRLWRDDVREFFERWYPAKRASLLALQRVELANLSDAELAEHAEKARAEAIDSFVHHFRINPAYMIAVGDFMANVQHWTGATRSEILALFEGSSPVSREGAELVRHVAEALADAPSLAPRVRKDRDAAAVVEALRCAEGELGEAARAWIEVVGHRVFTGYDISELTGLELPNVLLASLRAALDGHLHTVDVAAVEARTQALRARVDPSLREQFDVMLDDARYTYGLRDAHSSGCEMWTMGLGRRCLLEVGRRLVARALLLKPEHVFELGHAEVLAALAGTATPDRYELARYAAFRGSITADQAPQVLGPAPMPPPPAEWLPPAAARLTRAIETYLRGMTEETGERPQSNLIRGLSASGGKHIGTARLVLDAADFDRLGPGDVLIARVTTPTYNLVLPLLGGVVTDRGGVLSHPAIVAREYGIPGVVGTRVATTSIRDGDTVEIDGDAGIVRILK